MLTMAVAELCPKKTQRLLSSIITISVVVADVAFDGSRSVVPSEDYFYFISTLVVVLVVLLMMATVVALSYPPSYRKFEETSYPFL